MLSFKPIVWVSFDLVVKGVAIKLEHTRQAEGVLDPVRPLIRAVRPTSSPRASPRNVAETH